MEKLTEMKDATESARGYLRSAANRSRQPAAVHDAANDSPVGGSCFNQGPPQMWGGHTYGGPPPKPPTFFGGQDFGGRAGFGDHGGPAPGHRGFGDHGGPAPGYRAFADHGGSTTHCQSMGPYTYASPGGFPPPGNHYGRR